jgi:hypothetical protein
METRAIRVQNLIEKRDTVFLGRPAVFVLIVLFAGIAACAYSLRIEGIFSCQADGYVSDRYLAYCNGAQFGDYEHGAVWFDLEPSVEKYLGSADVIFLGDSFSQFAFSTEATSQWFSSASSSYYLLGFLYLENVVFEDEILRKVRPTAKLYVVPVRFFERFETSPAKEVMHDPASRARYVAKRIWLWAHNQICGRLSVICGDNFAVFRSRETGAYQKSGRLGPLNNSPVYNESGVDPDKIKKYSASGRSFLSHLPVSHDCIILTTVPADSANSTSIETAAAVAKELGTAFVPGAPDGLTTFDGSHLNQSSAERWSSAFFQAAGPQIRSCLKGTSRSRG